MSSSLLIVTERRHASRQRGPSICAACELPSLQRSCGKTLAPGVGGFAYTVIIRRLLGHGLPIILDSLPALDLFVCGAPGECSSVAQRSLRLAKGTSLWYFGVPPRVWNCLPSSLTLSSLLVRISQFVAALPVWVAGGAPSGP